MSAKDKFEGVVGIVIGVPVGAAVGAIAGTVAGVREAINSGGDAEASFKKFGGVFEDCVKGGVEIVADNAGTVAALVVSGIASEMDAEAKRKIAAEARRKQRQIGKG